jgi:serine/threonine protein phosphatase PrpC
MKLFGSRGDPADVRASMRTDPGLVRAHNEDACLIDLDRALFAVADGVGGQPAGDVAARIAIERLPGLLDPALAESDSRPDVAIERAIITLG